MQLVENVGLFGNPWTAASLHRDEIRNAGVLAWMLDPRGGHGLRDRLLKELLRRVGLHSPRGFPDQPSANCRVSVEECPDGLNASRIDIQIDDPNQFFVVIEAKIGAVEQVAQLERYCQLAAARACGVRRWAVVFLTPSGKLPTTAGDHHDSVVPMAWSDIAASLRSAALLGRSKSVGEAAAIPRFLARAFAAHIANF